MFRDENIKIGDSVWVVVGYNEHAFHYKAVITEIDDYGEGKPNKEEYAMYFWVKPDSELGHGLGLETELFLTEEEAKEQVRLRKQEQ